MYTHVLSICILITSRILLGGFHPCVEENLLNVERCIYLLHQICFFEVSAHVCHGQDNIIYIYVYVRSVFHYFPMKGNGHP